MDKITHFLLSFMTGHKMKNAEMTVDSAGTPFNQTPYDIVIHSTDDPFLLTGQLYCGRMYIGVGIVSQIELRLLVP